jgi:hypothetical protein
MVQSAHDQSSNRNERQRTICRQIRSVAVGASEYLDHQRELAGHMAVGTKLQQLVYHHGVEEWTHGSWLWRNS